MLRTIALAAASLASVAALGCGSAGDSESDPFALGRDLFAETGYLPSYQECVIEEAERAVPEERVAALADLPPEEQLERLSTLFGPAALRCGEKSEKILDPNASAAEIAPIKRVVAQQVAAEARQADAGEAFARCMEQRVGAMPDADFLLVANALETPEGERALQRHVRICQ